MIKSVMFYVMCALIAALIFLAIEYKKEIEHNRVLDEDDFCDSRLDEWLDTPTTADLSDMVPEDREVVQKILDAAAKNAREKKVMFYPSGMADLKKFNITDVVPPRADGAEPSKSTSDEIRPDWYKITPEIEAWDVINPILNRCDYTGECIGYLKDILKYVLRADQKNGLEDYKKAYTNLKQLIKVLEEGGEA